MHRISQFQRNKIIKLRLIGKSIPEISREVEVGKTTVQRYISGITVPEEFMATLKEKQGGSKDRAIALRANTLNEATTRLKKLSNRDCLILLLGLYWGEGTKRDFEIINSDPFLIQTFIFCLKKALKIGQDRLSSTIRVHSNVSIKEAKVFWSRATGIPINETRRIEVIEGKKKGKLQYGMCRIRVRSGVRDRLLIQAMISLIGKECSDKIESL